MAGVTIYTTSYCGYCFAAKRLLDTLGIPYDEIPVDGRADLRRRLAEEHDGWRTVPMVFIGERFVGGFSELNRLHQEGRLLDMVAAASTAP